MDDLVPAVTSSGHWSPKARQAMRSRDSYAMAGGSRPATGVRGRGEFAGQLFPGLGRGGAGLFEVTVLAKPGDVDDAEYEERRHEEFSAPFEAGVERLRPGLGTPDFVGEPDQDGFPEEIDAAKTAIWQAGAGGLFLAYTHEDSGLPFRIIVVVDLAGH